MVQYDTHVVLFSLDAVNLVRTRLGDTYEELLGHNSEVLGSTQTPSQTVVFTKCIGLRREATLNHTRICALVAELGVPALVETEHNFDVTSFLHPSGSDETILDSQLENRERDSSDLHFGDTHLYIPVNHNTRHLRETYRQLGYQHVILSNDRCNTPYAVVTAQPQSLDVLRALVRQTDQVAKRYGFELDDSNIKGERLVYFNCFGGVKPLPMTVGFKH